MTRLLLQTLLEYGFPTAAQALEKESGVELEPRAVRQLMRAVEEGRWAAAGELLSAAGLEGGELAQARFLLAQQQYLELLEARRLPEALACLRQEVASACTAGGERELQRLSGLLACRDGAAALRAAGWHAGPAAARRAVVAQRLRALLPAWAAPSSGRLEALARQAWELQAERCAQHVPGATFSLLRDHSCAHRESRLRPAALLEGHRDEVWSIAFSRDGRLLATGGRDGRLLFYRIPPPPPPPAPSASSSSSSSSASAPNAAEAVGNEAWRPEAAGEVEAAHGHAVLQVCFAPAEGGSASWLLLSAGADHVARLWRLLPGAGGAALRINCVARLAAHADAVCGAAWSSASRFVTASLDGSVRLWQLQEAEPPAVRQLRAWKLDRVNDIAIAPGTRFLYLACQGRRIFRLPLLDPPAPASHATHSSAPRQARPPPSPPVEQPGEEEEEEEEELEHDVGSPAPEGEGEEEVVVAEGPEAGGVEELVSAVGQVAALAVSEDGRWLVGSVAQQSELLVWDLRTHPPAPPARLSGHRQSRYVLRCAFGGGRDQLLASGSEDSCVYVWHRDSRRLLARLPGHAGTVNSVQFSPADPNLLASASDDRTVRLWRRS